MFLLFTEATMTVQRLNSGEVNGIAAAGAAESENRQLKEEIAVLHRVVAGNILLLCAFYRDEVETDWKVTTWLRKGFKKVWYMTFPMNYYYSCFNFAALDDC